MKKISDLILHKDHHILVINKPAGMPSQKDASDTRSAHEIAMAYAHRNLYVVHRLDQRVSGVLLLAKSKEAVAFLSREWSSATEKIYFGIVPKAQIPASGSLKHYLTYDQKKQITIAHPDAVAGADEALMDYEIVQNLDHYMVLKIKLVTGRRHQIRAQLAALDIPIKGDIKYGSKRTNEYAGIDLHAYSLSFIHPSTKKPIKIIAPFPEEGLWENIHQL